MTRTTLHNQPTRYELVAECGQTRILIAYSMRTGRHSLLTSVQKHGPALIALMGLTDDARIEFLKPARLGAKIGNWSIRFSGRTQRDAVGSELPWIGDHKAVAADAGRIAYEADVRNRPTYHDGAPRKTWDQLGSVEQWSWNRPQVA